MSRNNCRVAQSNYTETFLQNSYAIYLAQNVFLFSFAKHSNWFTNTHQMNINYFNEKRMLVIPIQVVPMQGYSVVPVPFTCKGKLL